MYRFCLCFFLLLSHAVTIAQQQIPLVHIPVELLSVKQGLSQGFISGILKDKDGFMWFATNDGLNKYDGYKVSVYRNNPKDSFSLPDNMVSGIVEDEYGNFWVATLNKGLFLFDKKAERFHSVKLNGLQSNVINSMNYQHGKLLIHSNSNALLYGIKPVPFIEDLPNINRNFQLFFDHNAQQKDQTLKVERTKGNQLFWTNERQLWLLNDDTLIQYQANKNYTKWTANGYSFKELGLAKNKLSHLSSLDMLESNILFLFENNRLYQVDIQQKKVIQSIMMGNSIVRHLSVFGIAALTNENLVIRIDDHVYHYNIRSNEMTEWNNKLADLGINVKSSYSGSDGISWFCTAGFGVLKSDVRKQCFHSFVVPHNASVFQMRDSSRVDYIPSEVPSGLNIGCIAKDQKDLYWMWSPKGFISYDSRKQSLKLNPVVLDWPFRHRLVSDKNDKLWMFADYGTDKQYLHQVDKEKGGYEKTYKIPAGPINNELEFVRDLYTADKGFVYLATEKGLYRLNTSATDSNAMWKIFDHHTSDEHSISSNSLWCICPDPIEPDKYLWLGSTSTGLDKFDQSNGKFEHYSTADGLPNDVVYGILPDNVHNLWMSTNKGLSCFNPATKTFRNYTSEDGLSCDEFNHFEYMKLKNGELFFGGIGGYTIFNPEEVLQKRKQVPIVFTGLSVSNKAIDWKNSHGILNAPITYASTITLQPTQTMFTITFASLEYRSNLKKFYKYKLQGFDNEWTEPTNKNEATFTNLSPGKYRLLVTGTNSDGVWNAEGKSIEIIILPAWYQTVWLKVIIALVFFAALYGLYRYRLKQQLKVFKVRNRIATDLHDEIGSTLSSIAMYSEAVQKMKSGDEKIPMVIDRIHANTSEVLEAMSDIVWAVNTKNDQLYHLLNRMRDFAVQISEVKGFDLQMTDNKDLHDLNLDIDQRKNIYLIFKEAMNNAAKYSHCTTVWVDVKIERQRLLLRIKDDGIGFDQTLRTNAFGGNGLFNMNKRAMDMKAVLTIRSNIGVGTEIELEVMVS